jgi:hypothetical protein
MEDLMGQRRKGHEKEEKEGRGCLNLKLEICERFVKYNY